MADKEGSKETDNESLSDWTVVSQENEEMELEEATPPDNEGSGEEEEEEEENEEDDDKEGIEEESIKGSELEEIKDDRISCGDSSDIETLDYPNHEHREENFQHLSNCDNLLRSFGIQTRKNFIEDVDSDSAVSEINEKEKARKRRSRKPEAVQDEETDLSLASSPALPDNLPAIKPELQYIHTPANELNSRLNLIVALTFACVIGLGLGHFMGWSSRSLWEQTLNAGQVRKLRELQDNLLLCMSSSPSTLTNEREAPSLPLINVNKHPSYADPSLQENLKKTLVEEMLSNDPMITIMTSEHIDLNNQKSNNPFIDTFTDSLVEEDTGVIFGDGYPFVESHFEAFNRDTVIKPVKDLTADGEAKYFPSDTSPDKIIHKPSEEFVSSIDFSSPVLELRGDMFDMFGDHIASADGFYLTVPEESDVAYRELHPEPYIHLSNAPSLKNSDIVSPSNIDLSSCDDKDKNSGEFEFKKFDLEENIRMTRESHFDGALYFEESSAPTNFVDKEASDVDTSITSSGESSTINQDFEPLDDDCDEKDEVTEFNHGDIAFDFSAMLDYPAFDFSAMLDYPEDDSNYRKSMHSFDVEEKNIEVKYVSDKRKLAAALQMCHDRYYKALFVLRSNRIVRELEHVLKDSRNHGGDLTSTVVVESNNDSGKSDDNDELLKLPKIFMESENDTLDNEEETDSDDGIKTLCTSSHVIDLACCNSVDGRVIEPQETSLPIELTPNLVIVLELKQIIENLETENEELKSAILRLQATNIEPIKIKGKEGKENRELRERINQLIDENEDIRLAIARVQYSSLPEADRPIFNRAVLENHYLRTSVAKLTHLGANLDNLRTSVVILEQQNKELISNAARVRYEQPMPRELKSVIKEMEGLKQAVIAEGRKKKPSTNLHSAKSYLIFMNEVLSAFTSLHDEDASVSEKMDSASDFFSLVVPKGIRLAPEMQDKVGTGRSKLRTIRGSLQKKWKQLKELTRPENIAKIAHETLGKMNRVIVNVVNKIKDIGHSSIMKQSKKPIEVVVKSLTDRLLILDEQFDKTWETLETEIFQQAEEDQAEDLLSFQEKVNSEEDILELVQPNVDLEALKRQGEIEKKSLELNRQMLIKETEKIKQQKLEVEKLVVENAKIEKERKLLEKLRKETEERYKLEEERRQQLEKDLKQTVKVEKRQKLKEEKRQKLKEGKRQKLKEEKRQKETLRKKKEEERKQVEEEKKKNVTRQPLKVKESKKSVDFDSHYFKGQYNKNNKEKKDDNGKYTKQYHDDDDNDEDDDEDDDDDDVVFNWSDKRDRKGGLRKYLEKPENKKKNQSGSKNQFIRRKG